MTYPLLAAALLLLSGGAVLAWIVHLMRRQHFEMERRFASSRESRAESLRPRPMHAAASPGGAGNGSGPIQKFFTFGAGYSWGMHASAPLLIVVAIVSAAAVWFAAAHLAGHA